MCGSSCGYHCCSIFERRAGIPHDNLFKGRGCCPSMCADDPWLRFFPQLVWRRALASRFRVWHCIVVHVRPLNDEAMAPHILRGRAVVARRAACAKVTAQTKRRHARVFHTWLTMSDASGGLSKMKTSPKKRHPYCCGPCHIEPTGPRHPLQWDSLNLA